MLGKNLVFCLCLGVIFIARPLSAQLVELPLEEIFGRSALIVEGRVIEQQSFWDNQHQHIFTNNRIQISRIFKGGSTVPATLNVITRGGIVGDRMERVSESVEYAPGDVGLFCLIPTLLDLPLAPVWENYGAPQGFFQYSLSANAVGHPFHPQSGIAGFRESLRQYTRKQEIILPVAQLEAETANRATPVISSFSPTSLSAGTLTQLTINGSNFGATSGANGAVRFLDSNSGARFSVDASDIISWSDNQIVLVVPSATAVGGTSGTGTIQVRNNGNETGTSAGTLTVEFAFSNVQSGGTKYAPRMVETNGNGGMTFTLSTSVCSAGSQDMANAIGRTFREWRCVSGVNWQISTSTTTSNSTSSNGVNIVTFDIGTPLPNGTLGSTTSYYTGCWNGSDFEWRVAEIDVNINDSYTWYYCDNPSSSNMPSGSFDLQSVMFHELGHGHQLSHIIDASAVMHRSISNNTIKRTLNTNETNGADYVLAQSANACGPGPMTLLTAPGCLTITMPSACNSAGSCTLSLPVELTGFNGKAQKEGILLEWATASERNNHYFTLERSVDAVHFEALTQVSGAGTSTQTRQYQYLDQRPLPGLNYYRLRQTDLDGRETLLGIVAVELESDAKALRVFPNPLNSEILFVSSENLEAGAALELMLTDLSGRLIRQQNIEAGADASPFQLDGLAPGAYILLVYRQSDRYLLQQTLVVKE